MKLTLTNLKFTTTPTRINEMQWEGAVTKINTPSDGTPGGAYQQVIFERAAVEANGQSMVNMPLNCEWPNDDWWSNPALAFTGHCERFVIGVVQKVWIDGDYLMCSGIIWKDNYYDVAYMIQNAKDALGFSVEVYPLESKVQEDGYEHVTQLEFTGLCICWSNVAAFEDTFLTQLIACKKQNNVKTKETEEDMNEEQMKAMLAEFTKGITEEIAKVEASVETKISAVKDLTESLKPVEVDKEAFTALEATNAELKAEIEKLKATVVAPVVPAPTATQTAVSPLDNGIDFTAELKKINEMQCTSIEKAKLRFALAMKAQK